MSNNEQQVTSRDMLLKIEQDKKVPVPTMELLMEAIMDKETGGDIRPDKTQGDLPEGYGRGVFQFENRLEKGKKGNTSSQVALNRLKTTLKKQGLETPEWVSNLDKNYDPADLTIDQQKMLFLGYHAQKPKSNFNDITNGKLTMAEWWGQNHQTQSDPKGMADFNTRLENIKKKRAQEDPIQGALDSVTTPQVGVYTVKPKDNFFRIAKANGLTLAQLAKMNPKVNPNIVNVGQQLRVK